MTKINVIVLLQKNVLLIIPTVVDVEKMPCFKGLVFHSWLFRRPTGF